MTSKEKAIDIIANHLSIWYGGTIESAKVAINLIPEYGFFEQFVTAKRSAMYSVEQILNEVVDNPRQYDYWQQIYIEIKSIHKHSQ